MSNIKDWLDSSAAGQVTSTLVIITVGAWVPPLGVLLWLLWKRQLKKRFREFGLVKPEKIAWVVVTGVAVGIGLKLVFKSIIMPLLGAEPSNPVFEYLEGNVSASLSFALFAMFSAGLGEEILFRGFLFTRLRHWLGDSLKAKAAIILMASLIFGIPHLYQGFYGAVHAVLVGAVFGVMYYKNKGNLWLLVIAHASYDLFAILLIYQGWDETLGRLFFP